MRMYRSWICREKDWEYYKEFLYEVVMKYMDIDEPALKTYFREKFLYE